MSRQECANRVSLRFPAASGPPGRRHGRCRVYISRCRGEEACPDHPDGRRDCWLFMKSVNALRRVRCGVSGGWSSSDGPRLQFCNRHER